MLISFHLPKAAGISFYSSLLDHYGEKIEKDYLDFPMHTPVTLRNLTAQKNCIKHRFKNFEGIECIHGHFLPLKYRFINSNSPVQYITWMREPAERIASQYYYMMRNYNPEMAKTQPLYRRVMEENWSLERYCLSKEFKNTCSQFLWGFPIKKLDFIGIVEDYDNDLNYFSKTFLGKPLKGYKKNYNPALSEKSYFTDKNLKSSVVKFHDRDLELYQYALQLKKARV